MINWEIFKSVPWTNLWEPSLMIQSLILQALYLLVVYGPLKKYFKDYHPIKKSKVVFFLAGAWLFFFIFGSPLDMISDDYLFSAHMVQHVAEILWMTPLFMLGMPDYVISPLFRIKGIKKIMYTWTNPYVAVIVYSAVFSLFHDPYLYELTLHYEWFHFFEHLLFFITAFFLWWPIIGILPEIHVLKTAKRMAYTFYASMLSMPITIYLIFTTSPWYYSYVDAPRLIIGLSPMADQQLGGLLMFIGMAVTFGSVFFGTYLQYDNSKWYE